MNEATHLLVISAITSLQIVFIHILLWPGMILGPLRYNRLPKLVQKPLYDCLICMTSVWGLLLWLFQWDASVNIVAYLALVGGINVLLSGLVGRAEDIEGERYVDENHNHFV